MYSFKIYNVKQFHLILFGNFYLTLNLYSFHLILVRLLSSIKRQQMLLTLTAIRWLLPNNQARVGLL